MPRESRVRDTTPFKLAFFDCSADACWVEVDDRIVECNQAAVRMFGAADRQKVIGLHPGHLSPANQPDGQSSADKARLMNIQALEEGFHRFEWTHCRCDGTEFPVLVTLVPSRVDNKPVLFAALSDLSAIFQAREARGKALAALTAEFDRTVSQILTSVGRATSQLEATAQSLTATAEATLCQIASAAKSTEDSSLNTHAVASAAEELSASIQDVGRLFANSTEISRVAVADAARTNLTIGRLAENSARIGGVVNLIKKIASQTNLLALNATIEAARAGQAGRGFAVVASEVKGLATQTGQATNDIGGQITAIQAAIEEVVSAILGVVDRIEEVNRISESVAVSVAEQSVATGQIASNVQQLVTGTEQVTASIAQISAAAAETGSAAQRVLTAARSLTDESTSLRDVIGSFFERVRAI